jgi:hypothetical protein
MAGRRMWRQGQRGIVDIGMPGYSRCSIRTTGVLILASDGRVVANEPLGCLRPGSRRPRDDEDARGKKQRHP